MDLAASFPSLQIDHPSGVRVDIPEGVFLEGSKLEVSTLDKGPSTEPFSRQGPYVSIEGIALKSNDGKPASVVIPYEGLVERPVLLVESLGRWIRVPAKKVRSSDGRVALHLEIDGLPLPWNMVVVSAPPGTEGSEGLADGEQPAGRLARLEQLRIVDKEQFFSELNALAASQEVPDASAWEPFFLSAALADEPRGLLPVYAVRQHLDRARLSFLRAYALIQGMESGHQETRRSSAVKLYKEGLDHLWQARLGLSELNPNQRQEEVEDLDEETNDFVYGGSWKLEQLIEHYCGTFAPWGLELTRGILLDDDIQRRGFDIRVLPYFGELPYVDITLPGGEKPLPLLSQSDVPPAQVYKVLEEAERQMAARLKMIPEQARTFHTVRLYSPRLYDWTTSEWLSVAKNITSGYSALYGLAVLGGLPVAGAVGAGATIVAIYNVAAPVLEYVYVEPIAREMAAKGIASRKTSIYLYDSAKAIGLFSLDLDYKGMGGGVMETFLGLLINHEEIDWFEQMRAQNSGAVGYTNYSGWVGTSQFPVPPIILTSNLYGPSTHRKPHPSGSYSTEGWGNLKMSLNYRNLAKYSSYNLTKAFQRGTPELRFKVNSDLNPQTVFGIHWKRCPEDTWFERVLDDAPDLQVVQWELEKELLKSWAASQQISLEELLELTEVKICVGDTWRDGSLWSVKKDFDNKPAPLSEFILQEGSSGKTRFAFAMTPTKSPFPQRKRVYPSDLTTENFGEWSSLPLFKYEQEARKLFTIRLLFGGRENLLEIPVGFSEYADQPSLGVSLPGSQRSVEIATAQIGEKSRVDIMEYLIPQAELEPDYVQRHRGPDHEYLGNDQVEVALLRLAGPSKSSGEIEYLDSPVIPLGDDATDEEVEEQRQYLERLEQDRKLGIKRETKRPEHLWIEIRVIRAPSKAMQTLLLEEMKKTQGLRSEGQAWKATDEKSDRTYLLFVDQDLIVVMGGPDDNTNRQAMEQLSARFRERIALVRNHARKQ